MVQLQPFGSSCSLEEGISYLKSFRPVLTGCTETILHDLQHHLVWRFLIFLKGRTVHTWGWQLNLQQARGHTQILSQQQARTDMPQYTSNEKAQTDGVKTKHTMAVV